MEDLRRYVYDFSAIGGGISEGFQSFMIKLERLAGSLVLNLHLMADPKVSTTMVSAAMVQKVHRLVVDFIVPHAIEFYRLAEGGETDRLQRLASWILTNGQE